MLSTNRVIWKDAAALKDLSLLLNDFSSAAQVLPFVAADDKLYIGSDVPFNHRYIEVSVANENAAVASVEIWDGDEWVPAVDVQDDTAVGGKTLARSGILRWKTDRHESWGQEDTTERMTGSGLETLKIYKMFWARISFSADLTNTTALKYVGHLFSKDENLGGHYPDLNRANVKSAFASGKTNWNEQHVLAAEAIYRDLRSQRAAWAIGQIFEIEVFTDAAVHKVAQIIYTAFGTEYDSRRDEAYSQYKEALEGALSQGIDYDGDGHVEEEEHFGANAGLVRR